MDGEATPIAKACPHCGRIGGLSMRRRLIARPLGTWSLAGAQLKTSAVEAVELACAECGMAVLGHIEGLDVDRASGVVLAGHFVADEPLRLPPDPEA